MMIAGVRLDGDGARGSGHDEGARLPYYFADIVLAITCILGKDESGV